MIRRFGSPESARAGVSLEVTGGGARIAIRAWHPSANIPASYIDAEELLHTLGARRVPRAAPAGRRRPLQMRKEIST